MIRVATIQDAPAVATVLIESRRAFQPFAPSVHPDEDVRRWVREELIPASRVYVWQVEELVAGVIAYTCLPEASWIRQLFVLPGWTGHGIGALLLQQAHSELEPPIHLHTFQQNLGARRFYERHGYVPVGYTDGQGNEEKCPDVLYIRHPRAEAQTSARVGCIGPSAQTSGITRQAAAMDKLYKPHFLSQLKARMPAEFPEFSPHKNPAAGHPLRTLFSGSKLYLKQLASGRCAWLEWFPCDGVDREFFAYLGWSPAADVLPINQPGDRRIYDLRGPSLDIPCGSINVQQLEGRQAIAGFAIATPWDQLYKLSPRVTEAERKSVMNKAYAEYLAVTDVQRIEAVRQAMNEAFAALHSVVPNFVTQLENLPGEA